MQLNLELKEECNQSSTKPVFDLKVGDRVSHKLCEMTGTIDKLGEFVAVIKRDKPLITLEWGIPKECWKAICLFENLVVCERVDSSGIS